MKAKRTEKNENFVRLLIVLLAVIMLAGILKGSMFFTKSNITSMLKQFPESGLLAIGIGLCMILGGIDLSVVGIANLTAMVSALLMTRQIPENAPAEVVMGWIILICIAAVLMGLACGAFNGFCIAKLGIPPILTTLGTQQLFTGITIVISNGKSVSGLPSLYSKTGNAALLGWFPVQMIVFVVCAAIIGILLSRSSFGKKMYFLGTNEKALRFTGLNRDRIIITTHALSGALAAIAGLVIMTRTNSAKAQYGEAYIMQGVLISVLGGFNPNGGKGDIQGVVLAILILQFLSSLLNMFEQISNFYRNILWGGMLIFVLLLNRYIDIYKKKKAVKIAGSGKRGDE